ncbi:ROK family protein [Microbacterium sp. NPDC076911]|uniref:ROK family protein n=1 Tax=Microbacterium sp. NPDC076911 TaxID=3154958 RepID=UPI0034400880
MSWPALGSLQSEFEGATSVRTAEESDVLPMRQRRHSMELVIKALQDASTPLTASGLMPRTDLSRQGVLAVCDALISLGLVIEVAPTAPRSATGVGRRSRTFAFNDRAGFVAGVELGPERIVAQLCNLRGDIVTATVVERRTPIQSASALIDEAKNIIDDLVVEAAIDPGLLTTVAVGVPAPVDHNGGVGSSTRVSGLPGINVIEAFSAGRPWEVLVDNDANLAVIGERWRGAAQGLDGVVLMLVQERFGAGIIDSGRIVRGGSGFAGQMEFVRLLEGGHGTQGIVPLTALFVEQLSEEDRTRVTTQAPAEQSASSSEQSVGPLEVEAVFEAASKGDRVALTIVDGVADRLARVSAVVATLLGPDILVFGCDVPSDAEELLEPVRRKLADLVEGEPPSLVRSELRDQAVAVGAVRCALDLAHQRLIPSRF